MKKILTSIMIAIIGITSSYAYTICAKNNTYVGVLRKNVNGTVADVTNGEVNGNQKKQWKVTYDYETGITSYWVYFNDYTTPESCASSCTSACANAMATNQTFRSSVFEAVW